MWIDENIFTPSVAKTPFSSVSSRQPDELMIYFESALPVFDVVVRFLFRVMLLSQLRVFQKEI